jgi:hypothetical protein
VALDAIEVAFEPCGVRAPGLENDFAANKPHLADITILADEPSEIERRIEMMFARLLHVKALNDYLESCPTDLLDSDLFFRTE